MVSITEDSQGDGQCGWVEVGYDKSHEQIAEWCEPGAFITQLDLGGGESPAGSWPIVEQALCCKP
ncbi:MAG: hypothetical protein F6K42_16745 [Leptolyngbya sp. SIO1D8]|nr:hypothetical protein [Leptolyngbya sp. SIO1D8]